MIELHLIGYTEDLEFLVFDRDPEGDGTYSLPVDEDLLATIEQLVEERPETTPGDQPAHATGRGTTPLVEEPSRWARDHDEDLALAAADTGPVEDGDDEGHAGPSEQEPRPRAEPPVALRAPQVATHAKLSPAEIQAQLRAGRSVRAVARDAGTDIAWVERWLAPILAERDRILREAREASFGAGRGRRPLGRAVDRNLSDLGVDPDAARWEAARRADGRWKVSVRFREAKRPRTATWIFDRDDRSLKAQSPLATELAGPRHRSPRTNGGARRRS